jgi:hypothetical protein
MILGVNAQEKELFNCSSNFETKNSGLGQAFKV